MFNETLRIERIARTQGGRYYCKAENGVGVPAIKSIRVDVQCELRLREVLTPHPHPSQSVPLQERAPGTLRDRDGVDREVASRGRAGRKRPLFWEWPAVCYPSALYLLYSHATLLSWTLI